MLFRLPVNIQAKCFAIDFALTALAFVSNQYSRFCAATG